LPDWQIILTLALRNLKRRRWKTYLAFISLTVTVVGFVVIVSTSETLGFNMTSDYASRYLFVGVNVGYPYFCDVLVTAEHAWWDIQRNPSSLISENLLQRVREIPGVEWASPYLGDIKITFNIVDPTGGERWKEWYIIREGKQMSRHSDIFLAGVEPKTDFIRLGQWLYILNESSDALERDYDIFIGYDFAKKNDVKVGDLIVIPTENFGAEHRVPGGFEEESFKSLWSFLLNILENPWRETFTFNTEKELRFRVVGIFWTSTPYDNFILTKYNYLQRLLGFDDRITCIFIKLRSNADLNKAIKSLWAIHGINVFIPTLRKHYIQTSEGAFGSAFKGVAPTKFIKVSTIQTSLLMETSTLLLITAIVYTNVKERMWEIGLLKAIGFKPSFITLVILAEYLILGLSAGFTGFFISSCISLASNIFPTPSFPKIDFNLVLGWGIFAVLSSVMTAMLASLIGSYFAIKIKPIEAMRRV